MFLKHLQVGPLETNCYIIADEKSRIAAIIDPGDNANEIINAVHEAKLKIKYIFLTHGHCDHIAALKEVKETTDAKIVIHEQDAHMLSSAESNLSFLLGEEFTQPLPDIKLTDNKEFKIGDLVLNIIHTPGHTSGGISIQVDNLVFTGDTLFAGSIGRTDFPGGSYDKLIRSIKEKLLTLPDDTKIYPGHGEPSTIGYEKMRNPFLR